MKCLKHIIQKCISKKKKQLKTSYIEFTYPVSRKLFKHAIIFFANILDGKREKIYMVGKNINKVQILKCNLQNGFNMNIFFQDLEY